MSDLIKVRTTMRPWEELQVGQAEYDDLKAQNLLLPGADQYEIAAAAAAGSAPPATAAAKKKGTQA